MMKKVGIIAAVVLWIGAGSLWAQEKVVIGGSGGLIQEMQELAKAYAAKHPSDSIQVLEESMSSSGGIDGVKAGRLTIGLVTRQPRGDERGRLVYRGVGRFAVGVGVHKSASVSSLGERQVCDIFGGRIQSWKEAGGSDGKIVVLTRKRVDDANTQTFRDKMACFRDLRITPQAVVLIRGNEVLDALDRRAGTVGIVSTSSLTPGSSSTQRQNIQLIAIDGVLPSVEALQNGKYKYYAEKGVVTFGEPQGLAKRFLAFIESAEGHKILAANGAVPVR